MAARDIRPQNEGIACAVCARTLLRGEQIETYLTGGQRRTVCELCVGRANHMGWIRERAGLQPGGEAVRGESRRPLLARIRSRRGRRPEPPSPSPEEATPAEGPPAAPVRAQASEPREPRHVHAIPTSGELKAERAVEVFNGSEHPRTVAGVARSLGAPAVAVHPDVGRPSVVRIVVAWELCWYRYEVDLADEGSNGVRVAGQGYELAELEPTDKATNAAADERGSLALS